MFKTTLFASVLALAEAIATPGCASPLYDCTYPDTQIQLGFKLADRPVQTICGQEDGKDIFYTPDDLATPPAMALTGPINPDSFYFVILANPDTVIPAFLNPIIHNILGNIKGDAFALGDLSGATSVSDFFPPNPPVGNHDFHYVYMVYEQKDGYVADWSAVQALGTKALPIESITAQMNFTYVTSNYFTTQKVTGIV